MGFKAHELRDMKPHEGVKRLYLNPPAGQALEVRRFPKTDGRGLPIH